MRLASLPRVSKMPIMVVPAVKLCSIFQDSFLRHGVNESTPPPDTPTMHRGDPEKGGGGVYDKNKVKTRLKQNMFRKLLPENDTVIVSFGKFLLKAPVSN